MWTRNYKNMIYTDVTILSEGFNGGSAGSFGDRYSLNVKTASGTLRDICNYGNASSSAPHRTQVPFIFKSGSDNTYKSYIGVNTDQYKTGLSGSSTLFVGFGSSGVEATELDYALAEQISQFTNLSGVATPTLNDDGTFTINYQITIQATSSIVIREIGLFKTFQYKPTSNSGEWVLINRIVLDEPISVASGEVANVTFTVTTPKITFS